MGDRGHRQLWVESHVKEWKKRAGEHEKGDLGWEGQGTSLGNSTFQSQGKKREMKGVFLDTGRHGGVCE